MKKEIDSNRRRLLLATAASASGLASFTNASAAEPTQPEPFPQNGAEALERLKAGNGRFAEGKTRHAHESADWRKHLLKGQQPFATILACSDSRVPPELVFDQGFGDLFVVRVAGNVIAPDVFGSIAYAAVHLKTPLFVVLGHQGCGAVTAALDEKLKGPSELERIEALLQLIEPGIRNVDTKLAYADLLNAAVEANVRWSVKQLAASPGAKQLVENSKFLLIGAVYDLATGTVRYLAP